MPIEVLGFKHEACVAPNLSRTLLAAVTPYRMPNRVWLTWA